MPVRFLKSESSHAFSATSCVSELSVLCVKIRFRAFIPCFQLSTVDCRQSSSPIPNHSHTYKPPGEGGIYRSPGQTTQTTEKEAGLKDQLYLEERREALHTKKQLRGAVRNRTAPRSLGWPGERARPQNREGAHPDFYSGDDVQRKPNETVGL
jgi:hypothetical protein